MPHRQILTLPSFVDSRSALPNSYPNACMPNREFVPIVCTIYMVVLI